VKAPPSGFRCLWGKGQLSSLAIQYLARVLGNFG
jgi:hypothetical protein